jgi:hypothetical protein
METTLFDKDGDAVAYISDDYNKTIYLWDGSPVAYLYDEQHVYGINGRHLGRFLNDIVYSNEGERIGFTAGACPVSIAKESVKAKKQTMDEIRSRWAAPPLPRLQHVLASQDFVDFLKEGRVPRFRSESSPEDSQD